MTYVYFDQIRFNVTYIKDRREGKHQLKTEPENCKGEIESSVRKLFRSSVILVSSAILLIDLFKQAKLSPCIIGNAFP